MHSRMRAAYLQMMLIDGQDRTPVPDQFLATWALDGEASEVTVATDGYPVIRPSLELSEQDLRSDLRSDPLRIGKHMTTKGVRPGNQSVDDRAAEEAGGRRPADE